MRRTIEGPPDCRNQRRHRSSDTSSCDFGRNAERGIGQPAGGVRTREDRPAPAHRAGDYRTLNENPTTTQATDTQVPGLEKQGQPADRQAPSPPAANRPHRSAAALVEPRPFESDPTPEEARQAHQERSTSGAQRPHAGGESDPGADRLLRVEGQSACHWRRRGLSGQVPVHLRSLASCRRSRRPRNRIRGRAGPQGSVASEAKRDRALAGLRLTQREGDLAQRPSLRSRASSPDPLPFR
jgi:hypothetical protein